MASIRIGLALFAAVAAVSVAGAGRDGASFVAREYPMGATPPDVMATDIARPASPRGEQLYSTFCAVCHGSAGRGDGRAAGFCAIPPADFTRAEFKVRSTPTGSLPSDADLQRVITVGAGDDGAMPGFPTLGDEDVRLLIGEVKRFSPRWARERPSPRAALPPRVPATAARGAAVYREWGCARCHGDSGEGDGPLASTLRHSRGHAEPPTDLTRPWTFKASGDAETMARSIVTGFTGTSMPAYALPAGREKDLWDLVEFLRSRQRARPAAGAAARVDTTTIPSYWRTPAPASRDDVSSVSCAACHPQQFADWSRSRHAAAMGPGVWAQMRDRPEIAGSCARCHAPLDRQGSSAYLSADGVGCSSCHVRAHDVFGPPPGPATLLPLVSQVAAPHGRVNVRPFFEQADFCGGCHQSGPGAAPVVHGTVLQNTMEEWRASRAAKEGRSCQSCHMPGRRHFFRGVHDPDTMRAAVRWTFDAQASGNRLTARMTLTNTGVGHAFPTYVVPQVWMRIELLDDRRAIRAFSERLIARTVAVTHGDWRQIADTRLRQDQTATLTFDGPLPHGARAVVGRVVVLPDAWQVGSLRSHLQGTKVPEAARHYAAALEEIEQSGYTLFRLERPL